MTKLHELLAVENSLETQAIKARNETADTFLKKRHLFEEKTTVFTSSEEGRPPVTEAQSSLQATVRKELEAVSRHIISALDAGYQVAETNTLARANVVLDNDTTLLENVPATALLELEKRLVEVRDLFATAPTFDPAKGFVADAQKGPFVHKAREITKTRTKKDMRVIVKYEATQHHPAQTELVPEDRPVGTISEQEWSGMLIPAEKAELLERAEQLIRAVRRARSRANEAEANTNKKIGGKLMGYLLRDK